MKAFNEFLTKTKTFSGYDDCTRSVPDGFTDSRNAAQQQSALIEKSLKSAEHALKAIRDDVFRNGKVTGRSQTLGDEALNAIEIALGCYDKQDSECKGCGNSREHKLDCPFMNPDYTGKGWNSE